MVHTVECVLWWLVQVDRHLLKLLCGEPVQCLCPCTDKGTGLVEGGMVAIDMGLIMNVWRRE